MIIGRRTFLRGDTFVDELSDDVFPGSCIDVNSWEGRIVCYGKTDKKAKKLRELVMGALEEVYGN